VAEAARYQYVWDVRYIDAAVCRDEDQSDPLNEICTDEADEHLYFCQEANYNVTALVDGSDGGVGERYVYDPYGRATVYDGTWTNTVSWGDGRKNALRFCGYRYDPLTGLYHVRRRGYHPALGPWLQRDPGAGGTMRGLAVGSRVRPSFVKRDPEPAPPSADGNPFEAAAEYHDGLDLYLYVSSDPVNLLDPSGRVIVVIPPRGGRGNPFHHQFGPTPGRFASRDAYLQQCRGRTHARVIPAVNPAVMMAVQAAAQYIATYGYYSYLESAADALRIGKARNLCRTLQIMDSMRELPCKRKVFTAYACKEKL